MSYTTTHCPYVCLSVCLSVCHCMFGILTVRYVTAFAYYGARCHIPEQSLYPFVCPSVCLSLYVLHCSVDDRYVTAFTYYVWCAISHTRAISLSVRERGHIAGRQNSKTYCDRQTDRRMDIWRTAVHTTYRHCTKLQPLTTVIELTVMFTTALLPLHTVQLLEIVHSYRQREQSKN